MIFCLRVPIGVSVGSGVCVVYVQTVSQSNAV